MPNRIKILPTNIDITVQEGQSLKEVLQAAGVIIEAECGGQGTCGTCAVRIIEGRCDSPETDVLTPEMIADGYVLSCQATALEDIVIQLPCTAQPTTNTDYISQFQPDPETISPIELSPLSVKSGINYGVACDVGTTTVSMKLIDLKSGKTLDGATVYNDQMDCGADIISRIIYAQKGKGLQELNQRIIGTVNKLIEELLSRQQVDRNNITCAVFSGNTTMSHLLLGIDPKPIREDPYPPGLKSMSMTTAQAMKLNLHPDAAVYMTPSVGSYVGGDITSGILYLKSSRESRGVQLFIDIGTNGELVVCGDDWMIGCACSAGPAFEGVGIKCGMRAATGAIEEVEISADGENIHCRVIGDDKPKGLCGSGLINLVAELFKQGIIDRSGKLNHHPEADRIRKLGNQHEFLVVEAGQTAHGQDICISEQDIANIIRAKAAIFSACSLLLKNIGLSPSDIDKIYVAGGFGSNLDFAQGITIGLFPDIELERFEYLGNTSLLGAHLVLISQEHRTKIKQIATGMTYIDLSTESGYMDSYTGALFLPHTNANLFPSVQKYLRNAK